MNILKISLPPLFSKGIFAKKWVRFVLDIVVSLLGLIFVTLLILLARLSVGPINMDFLTPEIEKTLQAPQIGLRSSIGHTQLVWKEWIRPFEIELVNVQIQKVDNPDWLKIDHIGVSLRFHRLLGGNVSLKQMRLYRPHILLEKNEKGEFSLGFGEYSPNQEFSFNEVAPLLALGESTPALGKLNELSKIAIINANIILKDEKNNQSWELPKATFVLTRQVGGFRTELTLYPKKGSGSLLLGLAHRLGSSRFDVYADFHHISFQDLIEKDRPTLLPPKPDVMNPDDVLNFLHHWSIPVQGSVHVALIPTTFQLIKGNCRLNFEKGNLDLSLAKLLPLPINSGHLSLEFTPQEIEIKTASLMSDKMYLNLSGKLVSTTSPLFLTKLMSPGQTLELQGKINHFLLNHTAALWPQDLAPAPREWLAKNLRAGTLTQATFSLNGHGSEKGLVIDDLKGNFQGKGAEITYLEGLPPAKNVNAHATFDQQSIDVKILSGDVENIPLQDGHIVISGLDTNNEALSLDVKAKGSLATFLDIINHKPLEYASYGGLDPKKAKGEGKINLHLNFPLLSDLQFKDVKIALKGDLKKVELERPVTEEFKVKLSQGNFSLDLTQDQMVIQGKGVLNQLPSTLLYTHYFKDSTPYELQIQAKTAASFEDFKRLGFDYLEYARGPTNTTLTYILEHDKKSRFLVELDTTPAILSFPPLEWKKNIGEKGEISLALIFKDGLLTKIKDLKITSPSYSLQGAVLFDPQKSWQAILLSEFKGPNTNTQVSFHNLGKDAYEISFQGESVDLEKFLNYVNQEETASHRPPTDIRLLADVTRLRLGEGKLFHHVKASAELILEGNNTFWKEVSLRAQAGEGTAYKGDMAQISGGILFDIKPGPDNTQTLEVRANDAGQLLKNLDIYDEIRGGYITIKAQRKDHGPYVGVFKLKNFDAHKVPLIARFAGLLSPMGIVNLLSAQDTLSMDRFECNFEFSEDLIRITKGIGKSISLGFTVEGNLNRKDRLFSLKGNIIPARFLNSLLSNIPVIGSFLNGGEGEGLFGIAYTVKGSFDAPNVSLNPLSALAPGFFRKIFQSLGEDE